MKIYVVTMVTKFGDGYDIFEYDSKVIGAHRKFDDAYNHAKQAVDDNKLTSKSNDRHYYADAVVVYGKDRGAHFEVIYGVDEVDVTK